MTIVSAVLWIGICAAVPAAAARQGLRRVEPKLAVEDRSFLPAAVIGTMIGACMHFMAATSGIGPVMAQPMSVPLVSLIAVAGHVDLRTAWAPSELMLPVCLAAGAVSPPLAEATELPPLFSGLVLFAAAHVAWEIQLRVGRRCLPPADFILLALPAILFGASILAAACYGSVAALLAFAGLPRVRSGFRGNPEALAVAANDLHAGSGTPVALVGLASPPLLGALAVQAVLRVFGVEA